MIKEVFIAVNSLLSDTYITIEGFHFSLLEYITSTLVCVIAIGSLSKLFD